MGHALAAMLRENPNKSLEGIKTHEKIIDKNAQIKVKTLINPWKGLKLINLILCGRDPRS